WIAWAKPFARVVAAAGELPRARTETRELPPIGVALTRPRRAFGSSGRAVSRFASTATGVVVTSRESVSTSPLVWPVSCGPLGPRHGGSWWAAGVTDGRASAV